MKPAWDKLEKEFAQGNAVVGNVDCTVHQGLCGENEVRGYPTIKYFKAGSWEKYQGGRDFESLKKHAEKIGCKAIPCEVVNNPSTGAEGTEGCNKKELKFIDKMKVREQDNLDNVIQILETCIEKGQGEECRKATGSKLKLSTRKMDWVKTKLKLTKAIVPMTAEVRTAWLEMQAKKEQYKSLADLLGKALEGDMGAAASVDAAVNFETLSGLKAEL